jgi:predicted outer membrane repeat protein
LSQRAIRRGQQRRQAAERRRETLKRRRAGLAVTAAIGATVLFAPAANAAGPYEVNTTADHAPDGCQPLDTENPSADCTLRDAVTDANASAGDDTVTFASGLSGTIALDSGQGQIPIDASNGGLTIQGPGADQITVSGQDNNRIFSISGGSPVSISALGFTHGYQGYADGGAIYTDSNTDVTIADSVFTNNAVYSDSSPGGNNGANGGAIGAHGPITVTGSRFETNQATGAGGGIFAQDGLTLRSSNLSGNTSQTRGGGVASAKYRCSSDSCSISSSSTQWLHSDLDIADSAISGNHGGDSGGGIAAASLLTLAHSTVSGNDVSNSGTGGGIASVGKYAHTQISDATISGNSAGTGGGIGVGQFYKYGSVISGQPPVKHAVKSEISNTTIADNKAAQGGGGVGVGYLADGDHFTITHSTISGNDAASSENTGVGGGIGFASKYQSGPIKGGTVDGEFRTIDTTISGNTADIGGGVSAGQPPRKELTTSGVQSSGPNHPVVGEGSIEFQNSTIASNSATANGGGVYLSEYHTTNDSSSPFSSPTIALTSTILADNTAGGAANDADRGDDSQGGGLDTSFSLVENPGDAPISQSPSGSTIIGVDPQLGPLADNGGPTLTHLPTPVSPVIDQGKAPARLLTDQRGLDRTVGGDVANAPGGDGTDIGAVEVQNPAKNAPFVAPAQQVLGDKTPPTISLHVPKSLSIEQLIAGFNVTVSCSEPCSMTFRVFGSAPTGTLHSAGYNFRLLNRKIGRKAGRRKVHLQPCLAGAKSRGRTHVCRTRITAALFAKPQKTFKVKLIVAAKDKAGNVSHTKRFIRIHR